MYASSSETVLAGTLSCTIRKKPNLPESEIGVNAVSGSYGGVLCSVGAAFNAVVVAKNSV